MYEGYDFDYDEWRPAAAKEKTAMKRCGERIGIMWLVTAALVVIYYVGMLVGNVIVELYSWAWGLEEPDTWLDQSGGDAPVFDGPHWAGPLPLGIALTFAPTWTVLDAVITGTWHGTTKLFKRSGGGFNPFRRLSRRSA